MILSTPLFNGNIAETYWKTGNDNTMRRYAYSYDALNRITSGKFNGSGQTDHYTVEGITYDKNGNIGNLTRRGHLNSGATSFGVMDNLSYTYDTGNKLLKVADTGNKTYGFKDGTNTNNDYTYDVNGNLLTDANKGITGITYNYLNLPTQVSFGSNKIAYIYDASGSKLKKTVTEGSSVTNTEYANGYIYENGSLAFFSHSEGYVTKENNTFRYVYQYEDHLGSVRLSYSDLDGNGSINPSTEILQERNTYPFGFEHRGYNNVLNGPENNYQTYLGQEINKELGLNWLTFRYRNYIPEIGRFFGVDPVAGEYMSISPYQFAHNNPVWKIELEGLEGGTSTGQGNDDIGNHEPVKAFVGGIAAGDATRQLAKEAGGKFVQETTKKSVAKKIFGSLAKGATLVTAMLTDYMSPNFGGETSENKIFDRRIDENLKLDDLKIKNVEGDKDSPIRRINEKLDDLKESSKPGDRTKGKSKIYEREGGIDEANKEFDDLNPDEVKEIDGGRRGVLPDGSKINVRVDSSDGRPTVEIIHPNNRRTKFRYNEPKNQ